MRKNLGDKGKELSSEQIDELFRIYMSNEEAEFSKIYPNEFFGYTKVTVEQPLVEDGEVKTDRNGNPKVDSAKRDYERVPLGQIVDRYFETEVSPHVPEAWMDRSKDKIGYEINFTKYFYHFAELRTVQEITDDLKSLDNDINALLKGLSDE